MKHSTDASRPCSSVVPASGHATDSDLEKKIIAFIRAKVAPHKRLRGGVRFIDIIPKCESGARGRASSSVSLCSRLLFTPAPSGKILRKDCKLRLRYHYLVRFALADCALPLLSRSAYARCGQHAEHGQIVIPNRAPRRASLEV